MRFSVTFRVLFQIFLCLVPAFSGAAEEPFATKESPVFSSKKPILDPAFSPDGKVLTFVADDKGTNQIIIFNLEKKTTRTVTTDKLEKRSPAFTGDGKFIVYCGKKSGNFDIFKVAVEGGASVPLTKTPEDEFAVESSWNLFDDPEKEGAKPDEKFYRVFYLKGKNGAGELFSMQDSGKFPRKELGGAYRSLSLGAEMQDILLTDDRGVLLSRYAVGDSNWVSIGTPDAPVLATGSKGLSDAAFCNNSYHMFARKGQETVLFDRYTTKNEALSPTFSTRVAASRTMMRARPAIRFVPFTC